MPLTPTMSDRVEHLNDRVSSQIMANGLVLLDRPRVVAANEHEVTQFAVKAEDLPPDRHAILARGRPQAIALTRFELHDSDITFDHLFVKTDWFMKDTSDPTHSYAEQQAIEAVLNVSYSPTDTCAISIMGTAPSRDVVGFLRALQMNKGQQEVPSKRTLMVLMKEWEQRR